MMKKISIFLLAMVMVLSLTMGAMAVGTTSAAAPDLGTSSNGELGVAGTWTAVDSPISQTKSIVLKKEITAYNRDESSVKAPTITYGYEITAGPAGVNVTDESGDHASGIGAITVPTKAGVGSPTITQSLSWTTADTLTTSTDGTANTKDITVNFSNVVFSGAGVYRYKITETPPEDYAATGVTEGNTNHVRFLDVYVRPSATFAALSNEKTAYVAGDWDIYGFVCVDDGAEGNTAVTPNTVKTNGFVDSNASTSVSTADKYFTYNLTISKTVENDAHTASTHQFPFTMIFSNNDITGNILLNTDVTGTVTDFTHAAGTPTWRGHADLLSGGSIKYIGIPMGTDVEVYETNDVAGTTYTVTTARTNATTETGTDNAVSSGTTISTATQAEEKPAYQSTKSVIDTTKDADDDSEHTIAITNKLLTISPTGVVLRIAPYALILAAGIALLLISRRRKAAHEEE